MKIRDLNKDDYVIVYDLGKSEYSEGMTVVGRVDEIIFNEDDKNEAGIDSLGNLYDITDNNYFDLWSKSIEGKTEHIGSGKNKSVRWIDDNTLQTNLGHKINIPEDMLKDTEFDLDSYVKGIINEMNKNDKSIFKVGLGIEKPSFKYKQSNDVQQRKRNKKIVQWSDDTKLKFIERVIQDLSPLAAYHIGNAIDVLAVAESKEDIEQARWSIQRAYENWD